MRFKLQLAAGCGKIIHKKGTSQWLLMTHNMTGFFLSFRCESIGVFEPGALKQLHENHVGGKGKYHQVLGNFEHEYDAFSIFQSFTYLS